MGILDDAIKEHLELKRQHGADAAELKQLEDEAFGAAERPGDEEGPPDPVAEAPTQFMTQPDLEAEPGVESEPGDAAGAQPPEDEQAGGRPALRSEIADLQEPPPAAERAAAEPPPEPAEEESPAMEHEAVSAPEAPDEEPAPSGPSTEEREAIAEQPTEMFDVEQELGAVEEGPDGGAEAPAEEAEEYEEDDDFWDEKRLSDELDQALEAPSEEERAIFDAEDDEPAGEPSAPAEPPAEEEPAEQTPPPAGERDEDVLEETPDFLEDAPEDDQLWFEQKPPKDFDFDD